MSAVGFPTVLPFQAANTTLLLTFGFKYFSIRCCPHSFLFSSGATSYPAWREQCEGQFQPFYWATAVGQQHPLPKLSHAFLENQISSKQIPKQRPSPIWALTHGFFLQENPIAQKYLLEHPAKQFMPRVSGTSLPPPVKPDGLCSYHSIQELDAACELGARLAELPEQHVPDGLLLAQAVVVPLCKRGQGHPNKSQRSSASPGSTGGTVTPQLGC